MFSAFFQCIWLQRGQILCESVGRYKKRRGVIDKPILELLTFGSNLDFSDFESKLIHFGDFSTLDTAIHVPQTHFWTLQYRNNVSLQMANRHTRIFDAG